MEAGNKRTHRKVKRQTKNKTDKLEPEHKETITRKKYSEPRGDHAVFIAHQTTWEITNTPVAVTALQPDTANAGCTFSENKGPCASSAKPGSGRHAFSQAKVSRAKIRGEDRFESRAKGEEANGGLIKWARRELVGESVMDAGLFRQKRPD